MNGGVCRQLEASTLDQNQFNGSSYQWTCCSLKIASSLLRGFCLFISFPHSAPSFSSSYSQVHCPIHRLPLPFSSPLSQFQSLVSAAFANAQNTIRFLHLFPPPRPPLTLTDSYISLIHFAVFCWRGMRRRNTAKTFKQK